MSKCSGQSKQQQTPTLCYCKIVPDNLVAPSIALVMLDMEEACGQLPIPRGVRMVQYPDLRCENVQYHVIKLQPKHGPCRDPITITPFNRLAGEGPNRAHAFCLIADSLMRECASQKNLRVCDDRSVRRIVMTMPLQHRIKYTQSCAWCKDVH